MTEAIFSKTVPAGGKTYFFDVKQAQNGKQNKYIQLTESRMREGQKVRNSITIFPDQLTAFNQAFVEACAKIS